MDSYKLRRLLIVPGAMMALLVPSLSLAQTTQQVSITLKEFMITPSKITVTQGQPVQFTVTNAGTVEHNFVVEMSDQDIEHKFFTTNLKPGETRTMEYTFPVAGDWEMYCPVDEHEGHGMKGEIEVMATSPGGMPSTGAAAALTLWLAALLGLALLSGGLLTLRKLTR
jgi:uncharacterized cupredoxin-like copper-binding protein